MSKPILFIDRDGTIIVEPKPSLQIDSFEKLEFLPGAITFLSKIQNELGYDLVMVTNQDGLGTASLPEEAFRGPHELMLKILEGEGVSFKEILIDSSLPEENAPTRKPRTGLVEKYRMHPRLSESYMIGDRETDMYFAQNLDIRGLFIGADSSLAARCFTNWKTIYEYLANKDRQVELVRETHETNIALTINLDGKGTSRVDTGLKFFDHMLDQIGKHGEIDIELSCRGDLEVDEHHTMEDVGLALGAAIAKSLGDKRGINRYSFVLPMDETRAEVLIDLSGRPHLEWNVAFNRDRVGDVPTEMFQHFFRSLVDSSKMTLHIRSEGTNDHHLIEGVFKAFARALGRAVRREENATSIPSTKGVIE